MHADLEVGGDDEQQAGGHAERAIGPLALGGEEPVELEQAEEDEEEHEAQVEDAAAPGEENEDGNEDGPGSETDEDGVPALAGGRRHFTRRGQSDALGGCIP